MHLRSGCCLPVILLLVSLHSTRLAAGQGLQLPSGNTLGSSGSDFKNLANRYQRVRDIKADYRNKAKTKQATACTGSTGWLCAANAAAPTDKQEQERLLRMAASPDAFDSRSNFSSAFSPIAAPGDQDSCSSCVGFAVAAAAAAAVATTLQVDGRKVALSVQDLQFCGAADKDGRVELQRACQQGWNLLGALNRLAEQQPVDAACLPYTAPNIKTNRLCSYCPQRTLNAYASQGEFSFEAVTDFADVQQAIREGGGVVTAILVNIAHMRAFFAATPKGIYRGSSASLPTEGHAVFVVGYSNTRDGEFWVVKNSYGDSFGVGGFIKVAYETCGIMPADNTFKVIFTPSKPLQTKLCVTQAKKTGCYRYKAQDGDFISKVAEAAGLSLLRFMLDNTDTITDLDKPLTGLQLLLCNPDPNSISTDPSCSSLSSLKSTKSSGKCVQGPWRYFVAGHFEGPFMQCTSYDGSGSEWCMMPVFDACQGHSSLTENISWKYTKDKADPDCMVNWRSLGCDGKTDGPFASATVSKVTGASGALCQCM